MIEQQGDFFKKMGMQSDPENMEILQKLADEAYQIIPRFPKELLPEKAVFEIFKKHNLGPDNFNAVCLLVKKMISPQVVDDTPAIHQKTPGPEVWNERRDVGFPD